MMIMFRIFRICALLAFISLTANGQSDTIYTNSEKIICKVKEVTQDAIRYTYPGEDIINTVYKNSVQLISYASGRRQIFSEASSFKSVSGAKDYDNVGLSFIQHEVNGLFKLGDVSAKAKGTTTLSSMEKVKERAYKKMKIVAAMMGANIIFLTQNNTSGNQMGGYFQSGKSTETNVAGVAYSNKLPSYSAFMKKINGKNEFKAIKYIKMSQRDPDYTEVKYEKTIQISNIQNESELIIVDGKIPDAESEKFRVISFDEQQFTLMYKNGERIYNFLIAF